MNDMKALGDQVRQIFLASLAVNFMPGMALMQLSSLSTKNLD